MKRWRFQRKGFSQICTPHDKALIRAGETSIKLPWISAHSGVKGNEKTDAGANKAAKHGGNSSARVALPALLQLPLPQNVSAIKQQFHEELQKRWSVWWRNSLRYEKVCRLDPQFPPKVYFTAHDKLNQRATNLIIQIQTQHIPLNKYLHRIEHALSARCEQCHEFTGTDTPETMRHFLFECQAYVRERFKFAQNLGRKAKTFSI